MDRRLAGLRVRGENTRDSGKLIVNLVGEVLVNNGVEGDRAPEGCPPLREDGCPNCRLDGEEGDDDLQHLVGKAADEVLVRWRLFQNWLDRPSFIVRLGLHLSRRRHPQPLSPQLE